MIKEIHDDLAPPIWPVSREAVLGLTNLRDIFSSHKHKKKQLENH